MIQISLLGRLRVVGVTGREADLKTRRGGELFAFLVLESGRSFSRMRLAEQFWGDLPEARSRRALNTELWRVAVALRDIGMDVDKALYRSQIEVGYLGQPDHSIDVEDLRAAMAVIRATAPETADNEALAKVEKGVAAYRGDLLESVYSDWCLLWRENLRAQHTDALEFLLSASMARQDFTACLRYARQLLSLDPLMEHVHRAIMRCHFHNGDRPLAMRQYALCEQLLREELGVEPMDETRRIQETILAVNPPPAAQAARDAEAALPMRRRSPGLRTPVQKIDQALSNLNTARSWLEDASHDLRRDPLPGR